MASKQECKWTCDLCKKEGTSYSEKVLPMHWQNFWICSREVIEEKMNTMPDMSFDVCNVCRPLYCPAKGRPREKEVSFFRLLLNKLMGGDDD